MARLMTVNGIKSILVCFVVGSFFGCACLLDVLPNSRIGRYERYIKQQNYVAALQTIREVIADPSRTNNAYLANIRLFAIRALQHYVKFHGVQPGMDEEAARYYEEGLNYVRYDRKRQVQLHHAFAIYYSWSRRNGLAIPYFRKELEYWKEVNYIYNIILTHDGLASCYGDMGQIELRDYYRQKALDRGKRYFVLGKRPSNANQWLEYKKILKKRMDDICRRPNAADEILELWSVIEPIVEKYIRPKYLSYFNVAEYMTIAGETNRGRQFYELAEEIAKKEKHRFGHIDLTCYGATISFYSGDYETASGEIDRCIELKLSVGQDPDPNTYRTAGLSHEGAGNLDRAIYYFRESIARFETTRSSYSVVDRAAFFRSVVRKSYWGLIRCLAKKALISKEYADFLAALQASELVRGRQFGELLDKRSGEMVTLESLKEFRNRVSSDEIILDYIIMDKEIVLFAFTKERQAAFVVPYEGEDFRRQVLRLVENLTTPSSDLYLTLQQLKLISHKVLNPVRDMVKEKRRIVVLPDGILNAIPFDLLTVQDTGYRPIIEDKVVLVAPSIRYLVRVQELDRQSRSAGLFAVADPAYARSPEIGGLSASELRAITRGSKYLTYFTPLPETRAEVESIATMFKREPVKKLFGASASESALKNADLLPYGHLHLATHGILGGDVPGIDEPALVLAEETGEDGFFTASEASELKLDAELTVLSACNTGTGKYFTGEGVMGMSRSFLLAGSRSVLVSLWSVPSKETEQLMVAFYRHLRTGIDTAEAIRRAKLEMMRGSFQTNEKLRDRGIRVRKRERIKDLETHPFYWAAFVPFGA